MSAAHITEDLLFAAEIHTSLSYSVIPLLGDAAPDRPKAPAVPWSDYQLRRAGQWDFQRWFVQEGYQALGIVTGRISSLVVLDFDDPDLFDRFSSQHPDLASHQVIQTRRGYHIYYRLMPPFYMTTRKTQGIDLLSDGCYVVARPSVIDGYAYKLIRGGMAIPLTQYDINAITRFIDQHTTSVRNNDILPAPASASVGALHRHNIVLEPTGQPNEMRRVVNKGLKPLACPSKSSLSSTTAPPAPYLTDDDLRAFYRLQVAQGKGRNNALFNVARTARDHGFSQFKTQVALVDLHIDTPPTNHAYEKPDQRQREAIATIRSAYSRDPRFPQPLPAVSPQIPNRARERLYALGLTCLVRTIEGLRETGIRPGQTFTRKQAGLLLRGIVGRDSIDKALHALAPDGQPFIAREKPPPLEPPPASLDAAKGYRLPEVKKCFFDGATKSGQIVRGRKPYRYIMPTNSELCRKLGVRFSGSDPMQTDDLTSVKKTRQATHREFIKRRAGQYYRDWLAKRLGVSVRTLQRYNLELHIEVRPMFHEQPITWDTLDRIPDEPVPGMFLMDDCSRRYPARREIAVYLLPKVCALYLMRQEANFYSLDPPNLVFNQIWLHRRAQQAHLEQAVMVEQNRAAVLPPAPLYPAALPRAGIPPPPPTQPAPSQPAVKRKPPKPAPKLTKRRARQPLPNRYDEALAQRVYNTINARTPDKQNRISLASARRAVFNYGTQAVETALRRLNSRRTIDHPAGFFMTVARSESRRTIQN